MTIFNMIYGMQPKPTTFTISRTEQSNMSSWWTYSDDAAWLTAWSGTFDDFFWYSAVLLNTSGVETAEMTQSWWVFTGAMTTLWNITNWDNVMIKFPVRWIKMTKSWSTVTLSITDGLGREAEWYQYYAHCTWTLSSPWAPKDAFYLGSYKWYTSSSRLKSWSWQSPSVSTTQANFCTYAKANGSWYNIGWFYQRMYIDALYMMKYWNPNSLSVVWKWVIWWSSRVNTWWTNSQTNATYWTTSTTTQIKLFWLEDRWGNVRERIWGAYIDARKQLCTMLSGWTWVASWWEWTWTTLATTSSWYYYTLSSIAGDNKAMFATIWTVNNSNYNSYYCSMTMSPSSSYLINSASPYNFSSNWAANGWWALVMAYEQPGNYGAQTGTRLMYMSWLS